MADNFTPGETVYLTATTAGGSAAFTLGQSANSVDCLVVNAGNVPVFVAFGVPAGLPAPGMANAMPVLAGSSLILRKGSGVLQCSAITASGTALVYFTAGEGN